MGLFGTVAAATGWAGAGGVVCGGFVAWFSLASFAALFHVVLKGGRTRLAISILSVKLLALLGLTWFALTARRHPDPIGFAVGVTCLPLAAVWEALRVRKSE